MATEILATGTDAADATQVTVTAGTPVTVFLKKASTGPVGSTVRAVVKIKSSGSTYHEVGALDGSRPAMVIDGPGTYLISREATKEAFGIEKE